MITVVEYQDDTWNFNLQTAFSVNSLEIAKEHFADALANSAEECQNPYIALTIYADDGKTYIAGDLFKTVESAIEWWVEHAQ